MFLATQVAARGMKRRGSGSIVNIASITGLRQAGGIVSYAVSKAAVIQLTKVAALEIALSGIRVNPLAPVYLGPDLNSSSFAPDACQAMINRLPHRRNADLADPAAPHPPLAPHYASSHTRSD